MITTFSSHTLDTTNFEETPPIGSEEYFQINSYSVHDKEKLLNLIYELLGKIIYTVLFIIFLIDIWNGDDYLTLDLEKLNMYDITGHIRSVLVSLKWREI